MGYCGKVGITWSIVHKKHNLSNADKVTNLGVIIIE